MKQENTKKQKIQRTEESGIKEDNEPSSPKLRETQQWSVKRKEKPKVSINGFVPLSLEGFCPILRPWNHVIAWGGSRN